MQSLQIRNICPVFDTKNMTFAKVGNYFQPKSELVSQILHYL
jgi:hypothetical protein